MAMLFGGGEVYGHYRPLPVDLLSNATGAITEASEVVSIPTDVRLWMAIQAWKDEPGRLVEPSAVAGHARTDSHIPGGQ